jgi:hypothetical protein
MFRRKINSLSEGNRLISRRGSGWCSEEHFRNRLAMERKRTELLNTPFMFILVDIAKLLQSKNSSKVYKMLFTAINAVTRETDIKGWYVTNKIIGIVFIEVDKNVVDLIVNKVKASIDKTMDPPRGSPAKISYLLFPEDQQNPSRDSVAEEEPLNVETKMFSVKVSVSKPASVCVR